MSWIGGSDLLNQRYARKDQRTGKKRRHRHRRRRSPVDSSSSFSDSHSSSDSEHEASSRGKKHKKQQRSKKEKERDKTKSSHHKRHKREKERMESSPVQLSKFLGHDKDEGVRRSAISGKKLYHEKLLGSSCELGVMDHVHGWMDMVNML
ncbi:hypothetical protein FCM35_KLT19120 [Carex littledalei]|uniref:Uncharacterized protein n=1 Tax=Carex littledalei TaxID=544730 RepID=A0A833R7D4_9POAL|nr:hypothetical protein FCM35_KLT19120 [Carex littledalei]